MISTFERGAQRRTELLLENDVSESIANTKVLIFGLGGVGSWCAECLVRSGVRMLTLVDSDRVCVTNCNRQLMATSKTVGQVKVEVLRSRLLEINPNAEIEAIQKIYEPQSADSFHMEDYDFIIDAIDSLSEKADLILRASRLPRHITFISSMGAALRIDPFKVRKDEFWKIKGDPLARALRRKFKKQNTYPARKFFCVYSEEQPMQNMGENHLCGTEGCLCASKASMAADQEDGLSKSGEDENERLAKHDWSASKAQINGSLCHITAIFGMSIAGIVIDTIAKRCKQGDK